MLTPFLSQHADCFRNGTALSFLAVPCGILHRLCRCVFRRFSAQPPTVVRYANVFPILCLIVVCTIALSCLTLRDSQQPFFCRPPLVLCFCALFSAVSAMWLVAHACPAANPFLRASHEEATNRGADQRSHCHTQPASLCSSNVGLPLGRHRRVLPTAIELLALSFLPTTDMAPLFYASKSLHALVKQFLTQTKALHTVDVAAAELARKYCKKLEIIDPQAAGAEIPARMLCQLVRNNRASMRRLPITGKIKYLPADVSAELVLCPMLEEFVFGFGGKLSHGYQCTPSILSALTPDKLPQLRKLLFRHGDTVRYHEDFLSVLKRDFKLTTLAMEVMTYTALLALQSTHMQGLRVLYLTDRGPFQRSMAVSFGVALQCLPVLSEFTLKLRSPLHPNRESLDGVTWQLPSVVSLTIDSLVRDQRAGDGVRFLPDIVAPKLQNLRVLAPPTTSVLATVLALWEKAAGLQHLHCSYPTIRIRADKNRLGRAGLLLRDVARRTRLRTFVWQPAYDSDGGVLLSLTTWPCKHLRELECSFATKDDLQRLLTSHTALERLHVTIRFTPQSAKSGPHSHADPEGAALSDAEWRKLVSLLAKFDAVEKQKKEHKNGKQVHSSAKQALVSDLRELVLARPGVQKRPKKSNREESKAVWDCLVADLRFPNLTALSIENTRFSSPDVVLQACPALQRLSLSGCDFERWLSPNGLSSPVKHLRLNDLRREDVSLVDFLAPFPALTHLELNGIFGFSVPLQQVCADLEDNNNGKDSQDLETETGVQDPQHVPLNLRRIESLVVSLDSSVLPALKRFLLLLPGLKHLYVDFLLGGKRSFETWVARNLPHVVLRMGTATSAC